MERETERPKHWSFRKQARGLEFPPDLLAEHIEPKIARAGMRRCMTLTKPEGLFHSAWRHVEFALNQNADELDDNMRKKYIGDASYLIARATNLNGETGQRGNSSLFAHAMTLNIFLPVFTKRALREAIEPRDCADIYSSFGRLFYELDRKKTNKTDYDPALYSEMLGLSLSARPLQPELLLYPGSPREESSNLQQYNHDGYFIRTGNKLPIQAKLAGTDKEYSESTQIFCIEQAALHALKRAELVDKDEEIPFGAATLTLVDLVVHETVAGDVCEQERQALNFMTRSVAGRYRFYHPETVGA